MTKRRLEERITEELQVSHGDQENFHVSTGRRTQDFQRKVTELWLVSNRSVKASLRDKRTLGPTPLLRLEVSRAPERKPLWTTSPISNYIIQLIIND